MVSFLINTHFLCIIWRAIDSSPIQRQKDLTDYCFKHTDRPCCVSQLALRFKSSVPAGGYMSLCNNSGVFLCWIVKLIFGLNTFYFIWLENGLGRVKMLCHSPLPLNVYTCIEIIIYSHNTFTHTSSWHMYTVTKEIPWICMFALWKQGS